jgi:peptide/nickel transport system ATP-binding protein
LTPALSQARAHAPSLPAEPLLRIEGLRTSFGAVAAVDGVTLSLARGRTLAVVGESGCGKSALSLSVLRLLPSAGRVVAGRVLLDGEDLLALSPAAMRAVRGRRAAMVFQEPMTSLNPMLRVGAQVAEALLAHPATPAPPHAPPPRGQALRERVVAALDDVRIADPARCAGAYPHQLSGGMRQRVMLAIALAGDPALLIADEPTTALDVTVQAAILALLRARQRRTAMAILLVTHDLGVVAQMADEVAVMYAGRVVEHGPVGAIFADPQHPYTLGLLACQPALARPGADGQAGRLPAIGGVVPAPGAMPLGCRFHPRCAFAAAACAAEDPALRPLGPGHEAACLRAPVECAA